MFGEAARCLFLVFSKPAHTGDAAELARWYRDVHAVDAMKEGPFSALRRYEAVGDYEARYLAIWEGSFTSLLDARAETCPEGRPATGHGAHHTRAGGGVVIA